MDNQKHRKPTTSKLKRILQCKSNVSPLPSLEKDLGPTTKKAPSSLQQSTNIHSFEVNHRSTGKTPESNLHQSISPLSSTSTKKKAKQSQSISTSKSSTRSPSACATKQSHSSTTMTSPTGVAGSTTTHGRRSSSLHYNNRSGRNQPGITTSTLPPPPLPSKSLKKARTDGPTTRQDKINATPKTTVPGTTKESSRRRHSCASTTQNHQREQRSRMLQDAKKTLVPSNKTTSFNAVTPSCSVLFSKASPAANAALAASPLQQQSYGRQCPPPMLSMEKSRSTPLRSLKVKTYNVSPTAATPKSPIPQKSISSSLSSPKKRRSQRPDGTTLRLEQDSERVRRQRELEDLISGRRGSTLKLSLTPKNILLN